EFSFDGRFPFIPPKVEFHPKQNVCRLHPNYYECGKVCLSLIGTWGQNDWAPNVSLIAVASMLEERFTEMALTCEPGVAYNVGRMQEYNRFVVYGKLRTCVADVMRLIDGSDACVFGRYREVILKEFVKNWDLYMSELNDLERWVTGSQRQEMYSSHSVNKTQLKLLRDDLERLRAKYGDVDKAT
ncbi:hypothetical protein EBT25_12175, partial [bacterium]|nr:hypothetical protein [bacterium]